MSSNQRFLARPVPSTRSIAIAALMGATILASPLAAARADGVSHAPMQVAEATAPPAHAARHMKGETVEQRITSLHTALKITPDEEADWKAVAQAMRDSAAATQKIVAERSEQAPQSVSAVDDLKTYEKFAQAHVDGLKNVTSSFETLYNSMPDAQKKIADQVFQASRHEGASSHS